ncbi:MAG: hypothetical protein V1678_03205, partial [Candidatus Aenigmatarchaeota archaeon]
VPARSGGEATRPWRDSRISEIINPTIRVKSMVYILAFINYSLVQMKDENVIVVFESCSKRYEVPKTDLGMYSSKIIIRDI